MSEMGSALSADWMLSRGSGFELITVRGVRTTIALQYNCRLCFEPVTKMTDSNASDDVDYGPLTLLAGTWRGDQGMDVAPDPTDNREENPYFETIVIEPAGQATNAERQDLSVLRYHQVVSRKSDGGVFHNESGYWMWDAQTGIVMLDLTIPRGVALVAGGRADGDTIEVRARAGDEDWAIVQSPFMRDHARTVEFVRSVTVSETTLAYRQTTYLDIYGERRFEHTDENTLTRA